MSSSSSSSTELLDEYYALLVEAATGTDAGDGFRPLDTATISWNGSGSAESEGTEKPISSADTLVVVDMQHDFLPGGAFGVHEGDATIEGICDLIQKFHGVGATVIATRDYHPKEHCSFTTHGGPFPPHCIMGTHGSLLHPRIAETLQPLLQLANDDTGGGGDDDDSTNRNTHVVYKGFFAGVESFGGFPYDTSNDEWKDRLSHVSEEAIEWSGAWALRASAIGSDANAPPDVMSLLNKKPCLDLLPKESGGRVFCCGLAMDYCVLDTAVNFVRQTGSGPGACFLVKDLTRAARVPGLGCFGSGFLTDPNVLMEKLASNKIRMARFVE